MIATLFLALLVNVVVSQTEKCGVFRNTYAMNNRTGSFGCCGIGYTGTYTWQAPVGYKCNLKLSVLSIYYADNYLKVLSGKSKQIQSWTRGGTAGASINGTDLRVQFIAKNTDSCDTKFLIQYTCEPSAVHTILNNVEYIVTNQTTGGSGFVYLNLDPLVSELGRSLTVTASTVSYQGLKAPGFYIGNGYLPSLEEYDYTNTTVKNGNSYTFNYVVNNVPDGTWTFAMFSYGKFAQVLFKATWLYNLENLQNDDTQTGLINPTKPWIRQLWLNQTNSNILFEYSREQPGGHTTFLVGTGFIPNLNKYTVKKSTQEASFGEIAFPKPAKDGNNPGLFIVKAITTDATAGFLFRSTWR